jgi:hypothetical protein
VAVFKKLDRAEKLRKYLEETKAKAEKAKSKKNLLLFKNLLDLDRIYIFKRFIGRILITDIDQNISNVNIVPVQKMKENSKKLERKEKLTLWQVEKKAKAEKARAKKDQLF